MEVSKLTISDKLKVQKLSTKEKRKKILKLLRQAESDGRLAQAKSRRDLYRLAGYQAGRDNAGIAWAYVAIKKRGDVIEELDGFEDGTPVYRYRLSQGKTLKKEQSKSPEKSVKLVVGEVSLDFTLSEETLIEMIKRIFKK